MNVNEYPVKRKLQNSPVEQQDQTLLMFQVFGSHDERASKGT